MIGVSRSTEVPPSLVESKAEDRYRSPDVVEQLARDFNNKCYICEIHPVTDPQVEHRLPHHGGKYPERKFEWSNLFYSCTHCNTVKNKPRYADGIIDCCERDPELLLRQELSENTVHVTATDSLDAEAVRTAQLIEEVFMTDHPALRSKAADARLRDLQACMNALYAKLEEYSEDPEDGFAEKTIVAMLRPEAKFAGFARFYVRSHLAEYPKLSCCVQ